MARQPHTPEPHVSPTNTYRQLFGLTGPLYILIAFAARLPLAMSQLGALLMVSATTGSYAAGGATAGALAVANAVGSPLAGGLTDRLGQRPVLIVQSLLAALGLGALVVLDSRYVAGSPWWPLAATAGVAGLFLPQIGVMARVRWRPISRAGGAESRATVDAAFSYEGAADEAAFVLGPALVGGLGAVLNPELAMVCAALLLALFGIWFAVHPTVRLVPPQRGRDDATGTPTLPATALAVLAAVQLCIGVVFGSVQTGTSVLATDAGEPGLTGLFHGLLGVGSMLAGLAMVTLPDTFTYPRRLRLFTAAMAVFAVPLLWVSTLPALAAVLLVLGLAIAPSMITTFTVTELITPTARLGAAMTLLAAITGLGYAIGSSVAGRLADWGGFTPAYAVTLAGAAAAAVIAWAVRPHERPAD